MAVRVARKRTRRKPATVKAAVRRAAQRRVRQAMLAAIVQVVRAVVEAALQLEVSELLGRERYTRRATAGWKTSRAKCSRCGGDWPARFWRAGSYRRTVLTVPAAIEVRVPRLGCICSGSVPLEFATVGRYQRGWGDLQERARELAGLGLSLAASREVLAQDNGQVVAASTLNGWVQQAASLAEALRAGPLETVPPVVLLDGIWLKLLEPTGEWFTDRQGRRRERVKRTKLVLLVAYGLDPVSGERWVLDWERASGEDQASWQRLLERLLERGLRVDTGLAVFVHDGSRGLEAALDQVHFGPGLLRQRCVFHVLKNVRDAVRGEPDCDREAKRARRREVLAEAAAIWQTTERAEVDRRRAAFRQHWAEREPAAVAVVDGVFAATVAYLPALERGRERGEVWQARYLRTTSPLERLNRALRQKARQVGVFKAEAGLLAGLALVFTHSEVSGAPASDDLWTEVLEAGLLAARA